MVDTAKFLSEFVPIFSKYDAIIKSKRENSEYYNIFSILNLERKEVKLHSRLIADLLNPYSMHGCGFLFLKEFLRKLKDISNLSGDNKIDFENIIDGIKSAKVETEKYIGGINEDYTQGGRIDIFIELLLSDKSLIQVVIENKIEADEQLNQVSRYYEYLCSEDNKVKNADNNTEKKYILYLTEDGEEPTEYSIGDSRRIEFIKSITYLISYKDFILPWIEECIKLVIEKPKIREILIQYRDILFRFRGLAEVREMSDELISKLLEGDMLKYVCRLANYIDGAKLKIIEKLKNEIERKLTGKPITFICNISAKQYSNFSFKKDCWCYHCQFEEKGYTNLIECVYRSDKEKKDLSVDELSYITERFPKLKSNSSWFVCYDYVRDDINGNKLLNWTDELFCDMNKNISIYADCFIEKAEAAFHALENNNSY